ncbi:MAG TPA: MFS transporter [Actinophytocola sp.]|uniref:MFS transporter n=1 Tax=Actinophytocola sp. TaxID=1872138 RepID=UPI002DBBAFE9|nr:MFS transporter [Actinophytocola sp.]HEU5474350.1 MFS transporter [Actinophytocola sp.]
MIDSIGNGLFLPLGLIFFTKITDVPLVLIGVLLSVANVMQLPIPVFAGALADRYGARPLVVLAQVLQALGYFAAGLVTGPVGILVSAVLTALGVRFFWSSIFTLIADYVDGRPAGRSKDYWYGWTNMARTAGLGIGGVLTGIALANPQTGDHVFRMIAFGAAACFTAAAVTIALVVRAPRAGRVEAAATRGYRDLLRDRPYLGLVLVNAVFALSSMMLALALPALVLIHLDAQAWLISALLVGNTIVVSVVTAPVVLWLRPFRRTRIVATAGALWAGWALLLAVLRPGQLAWAVPVLIAATVLYTAATVIHAPVSMGLAAAAAPVQTRGRYLAIFQYSFTIAEIVGPGFFTTLFAMRHGLPWVALAVLNGLAVVAVLALERRLPTAAIRDE